MVESREAFFSLLLRLLYKYQQGIELDQICNKVDNCTSSLQYLLMAITESTELSNDDLEDINFLVCYFTNRVLPDIERRKRNFIGTK